MISTKVIKWLKFSTIPLIQQHTIGWLSHERDINVNKQCCMSYGIKDFKNEVLCDISLFEICDLPLVRSYMSKKHSIYKIYQCDVIITLWC